METNNQGAGGAGADEIATSGAGTPAELVDNAILDSMKALTADEILGTEDLPTEWVPVKEWGGKVLVRALSGTERDRFESSIVKTRGNKREANTENIRAKLAQLTIVDPFDKAEEVAKRRPLFTPKQIDALGRKSAAALDRVYDVAARLSGLTNKDVEELAGNSETAAGADS